jgi:hypothetical protein
MSEVVFTLEVLDALGALTAVLTDPRLGSYQPGRAALLDAVGWLELEVTCGDCVEGRCHWGGAQSAESIADAAAGREHREVCGCDRHEASVQARERAAALRAAGVLPRPEPMETGALPGEVDPGRLVRRRAAEFLASEVRDATDLAVLAQYAHFTGWDETAGMTRTETEAYLAKVHEAALASTVTVTWPDGASEFVEPVAEQPEVVFALCFGDVRDQWVLRGVRTVMLVDPGHAALRHFPCGPDLARGPGYYVADRSTLSWMRRLTAAELAEMDAQESQREQGLEGAYSSGQFDDPDLGRDLDYDDEGEADRV